MAPKSIPISFRITPDDAAFIAQLNVGDAVTPSEKIRELIAGARRDHTSRATFGQSSMLMRENLAATASAILTSEHEFERHSELIRLVLEWLPETMACFITTSTFEDDQRSIAALERLEREVAERTIRLLESVLRMAVTSQADSYDPDLLSQRLDRVLELASLISNQRSDRNG